MRFTYLFSHQIMADNGKLTATIFRGGFEKQDHILTNFAKRRTRYSSTKDHVQLCEIDAIKQFYLLSSDAYSFVQLWMDFI